MAVINKYVQDVIEQTMMEYSAYVVLQRAIPDLRDGFKPVERRILYTMKLENATRFTKSANIEGAVMKLHPHGSSYGTMVNMAQKDRQQNLLIVGKGNFAQVTSRDLQPAASRYTEVKLSDMAIEMMEDLNKNIVDIVPNYDGTMMQPEVLPVKFPAVLIRPSSGVAVGMASSIPSFNLKELCEAIVIYIQSNKKTTLIPDFATGGYIIKNENSFNQINEEGRGTVTLRGKAEIDKNIIRITEIPFSTTREAIIEKIVELVKSNKMKEVTDVKDLTGLKGMLIEVKFRRGTDMDVALEKLYQLTPLQSTFSTNLNVISNKIPKVVGVWQLIDEWLIWRRQVIIKGLKYDIEKMEKNLHILRGLEKVLLDIDKAIEIIRSSPGNEIENNLSKNFGIDEVQAHEVAEMKLRNINEDYIIEKLMDVKKLESKIADCKDIINNEKRVNDIIVNDLNNISKKYGTSRATEVIEVNNENIKKVKKQMEEIPSYPVKIFITKEGYVRKLSSATEVDWSKHALKPGDEIIRMFETYNDAELLVFGDDQTCYKIKINDLETISFRDLGVYIPTLCEVKNIVGVSILDGQHKFIIIAYDNNKIAKVKLSSFEGNRRKLINSLAKNAKVVGILTFKDEGKFRFKTDITAFDIDTTAFEAKERYVAGSYGPRKGKVVSIRMV